MGFNSGLKGLIHTVSQIIPIPYCLKPILVLCQPLSLSLRSDLLLFISRIEIFHKYFTCPLIFLTKLHVVTRTNYKLPLSVSFRFHSTTPLLGPNIFLNTFFPNIFTYSNKCVQDDGASKQRGLFIGLSLPSMISFKHNASEPTFSPFIRRKYI